VNDERFCPRCGAVLLMEAERPRCSMCDFVLYRDPKVAVAAVIQRDGGILLGKRAIDPGLGLWSFPAGYVDRGEALEEALQREVLEELGLEVQIDGLVGVYSRRGAPVVLVVFAAHAPPGAPLVVGAENTEVAPFPADAFPEMAFPHDRQIVADWRKARDDKGSAS
jgi:8-oxo-dGTP diphosphatase